jgi:hypothetical protein
MIEASEAVFPNNAVSLIGLAAKGIDPDLYVVYRPLKREDTTLAFGVYPALWTPDQESNEMRGVSASQPTVSRYTLGIQGFIKDMDAERGLNAHSVLSSRIRAMLYGNNALRVGLRTLVVELDGSTERTLRFGISTQRYLSNELGGSYLYLSTLEFWLETETT